VAVASGGSATVYSIFSNRSSAIHYGASPYAAVIFLCPEYDSESVRTKGRVVLSTVQYAAVQAR
jgi:hypothetical protein